MAFMKHFLLYCSFLSVMMVTPSFTEVKDPENLLHYLVREPKVKTGHPPVILLLHGLGSNEKDLFSFADQLPADFLVISARAPYTLGKDSYAWFQVDFSKGTPVYNNEQAEKSRTTLIEFITLLQAKHHFDEKQLYLCGFSQGAIMSYGVGLTDPGKVKGIAIMSGRLLEDVKPILAPKDKLKSLKVFISHGTKDHVLDIRYAREVSFYLKTLGIEPFYKEYAEGHGINADMFKDLLAWLKDTK